MSNVRFFNGGRDSLKRSAASEVRQFELKNGIRFTNEERFKRILQKKFEEHKNGALAASRAGKKMPATLSAARQLSKNAQAALKQMAAKKAAKEVKALRKRVHVHAANFNTGRLTKKGEIYDIAGNIVGKVNLKDGKMKNMTGWTFGKYKRKSYYTNILIQDAITKFSPHYIKLRKLQEMQQQGLLGDVINVHGLSNHVPQPAEAFASYGEAAGGPRQNIGVTAFGVVSDNVWGTFTDNVWGKSLDNVWGTNCGDVWGGIGGSPHGSAKSYRIWGTGNGVNHLRRLTNFIAALFGLKNKKTVRAFQQHAAARSAARAGNSAPAPRSSAPTGRR